MTQEKFNAIVSQLEIQARNNPSLYRFKVFLLALFGNFYLSAMIGIIGVIFLCLLASIAFLKAFAIKLIIIVGGFLWMICKSLFVKIPPPTGRKITRKESPELFALIDEIRTKLKAPKFHHVIISRDFNAGIVQSPRLGILGWNRNYLIIGLPLLKALTKEQFKAVLAHEFGHLAKGHGRMSNWIYCQRLRWSRLMYFLSQTNGGGDFLFKPFLMRFSPYFDAYSYPLARANEYEADTASVRLTSSKTAAEALTGVSIISEFLANQYWPQIHEQADNLPQPSYTPYLNMGKSVTTELDKNLAQKWLQNALEKIQNPTDTHPALKARLAAIGEQPTFIAPTFGDSADALLGLALHSITDDFDNEWKQSVLPSWEKRYQEVQEARKQLDELNNKFSNGIELSVDDTYLRASLTDTVGKNIIEALSQFRSLYKRTPDNGSICYSYGARLLWIGDPSGIPLIERAMLLDENLIIRGAELLGNFYWRISEKEKTEYWHTKMVERSQLEYAAYQERERVTIKDIFESPNISEKELEKLRSQLSVIKEIQKVYLVKKKVNLLPHQPYYLLGFSSSKFYQLYSEKRAQQIVKLIQQTLQFSYPLLIINIEDKNSAFARKFKKVKASKIL